jgi:hypothetical protein
MPWVGDTAGVADGAGRVGVGPPGDGETTGVPTGVPVVVGSTVPVCVGAGVGAIKVGVSDLLPNVDPPEIPGTPDAAGLRGRGEGTGGGGPTF